MLYNVYVYTTIKQYLYEMLLYYFFPNCPIPIWSLHSAYYKLRIFVPEKCFVKSKSKMEKVREIYWRRKENSKDWLWFTIECEKTVSFSVKLDLSHKKTQNYRLSVKHCTQSRTPTIIVQTDLKNKTVFCYKCWHNLLPSYLTRR